MQIQLSDHFTYRRLLRFVLSPVAMMIFTSVYGVVDGLFVSNFAGADQFAALNLIYPVIMILGAFGFMMGTGGTAIVSKTMGEGDLKKANRYFSLLVYVTTAGGVALGLLGIAFIRPVARLLGAEGEMVEHCAVYGIINLAGLPFFMLQNMFQSFFVTAEKPRLGLVTTIGAGVANMALDALFVGAFKWQLAGAAAATIISQAVGGIVPLVYFFLPNGSLLRLGKTQWYGKMLWKACFNGSSELLNSIASSVVAMLYNRQLLVYAEGNSGVAAYGVLMYVQFVFCAIFIGYSIGTAPIVGYNFGAKNRAELKNIFRKSLVLIAVAGVAMFVSAWLLAPPLASLFVGYDAELKKMTVRGLTVLSLVFLTCGFNIFTSSFFTALNNGVISAIVSVMRTLVFSVFCVLVLPTFLGLDGIWWSVVVADVLSLALSATFLAVFGRRYGYLGKTASVK